MVKTLIFLMLFSVQLMAQNVIVTSEMNYTQLFAGTPLTGTVTITHDKNAKVDLNSFKVGTKPLTVSLVNNVTISDSSPLIVSIYSFEIPPLPKGLHVLPQISVKVEGKTYQSYSISFEVFGSQSAPNVNPAPANPTPATAVPLSPSPVPSPTAQPTQAVPNGDAVLKLETKVEGDTTLYPGQEIKFIYRFLYRGHIELTKETLPLLEAAPLKKVGDKQNKDYVENNLNVSEFSQTYQADQPGIFQFGASIIEGNVVQETPGGGKVYATTPLHSETPPILIEVHPFPGGDKPASFNGAIGEYRFKASIKGPNNVMLGEKLVLLLEMSGDPAQDPSLMATVQAPDLCCQPGFSGLFKPSDLPPISSIVGNTKQFLVELRPLSALIKEVPPIEFSSFDLKTSKYLTVKSAPIPLSIREPSSKEASTSNQTNKSLPEEAIPLDTSLKNPEPIEISPLYPLTSSDLHNKYFGSFWNLLLIPAFAVLLLTQAMLKKENAGKKPKVKAENSLELLKNALSAENGSPDFYRFLQKALLTALQEKGVIESAEIEPENLQKTGLQGDVRVFLTKLEEIRFSGIKNFNQAIISSGKELYTKITGVP